VNVVEAANAAAVVLNGPGLESGLVSGNPTHFLVDASKAGDAELELSILDSRKNAVPYMLSQNPDNTYRVSVSSSLTRNHISCKGSVIGIQSISDTWMLTKVDFLNCSRLITNRGPVSNTSACCTEA